MKQLTQHDVGDAQAIEIPTTNDTEQTPKMVQMADRALPQWAFYISVLFAFATALCIAGVAVTAILFQEFVAQQGDTFGVVPFLAVAMVPVIGLGVLEFAQSKAFAGIAPVQEDARALGAAAAGVLIIVALACVHPFLIAPPIVAIAIAGVAMRVASRFGRWMPAWDFSPSEAVSILSGRDHRGFGMAKSSDVAPASLRAMFGVPGILAMVFAVALGSWMVATSVLMLPALIAVVGLSGWSAQSVAQYLARTFCDGPLADPANAPAVVQEQPVPKAGLETGDPNGLVVHGLTVTNSRQDRLISDVHLSLDAGTIVGLLGPAACGKSVLAQTLVSPHDLQGTRVTGAVRLRDHSLWDRKATDQSVPAALISGAPKMLPFSGAQNLMAFQPTDFAERARRCLESLVFSADAVDRILQAPLANRLSLTDQRALELARMLFIAPPVMVLDRPEAFSEPGVMRALAMRLVQEKRAGRTIILITEDRALLDICDTLMVMQQGRVIDCGPADEIQNRATNGWARFVCDRRLESEEVLVDWLAAHFKRKGDQKNQDNVARIGAELLAFSCQDVAPLSDDKMVFD
ncbi:MAG: ATP-binding cassette domain-containing protein, partial [Pseudomonadota bacterium]